MPQYAVEQGQVGGAKSTASRKRNLGNSRSAGNLRQGPRLGTLQLGHLQQIAWVATWSDYASTMSAMEAMWQREPA